MIVHWEVLDYPAVPGPGRGYVLRVTDNRGFQGLGEARAIDGFGSGTRALQAFLSNPEAVGRLIRETVERLADTRPPPTTTVAAPGVPVEALFAVESAVAGLLAARDGQALVSWLGFPRVPWLQNSLLVGNDVQARELAGAGHRHFKLKAHGEDRHWRELFRALVELTGGQARIRVDANGSWDRSRAEHQLAGLPRQNLAFVEQPFPPGQLADNRWLRETLGVAVAVDEGATDPDAVQQLGRERAADLVVIKPMFRGLYGSLALARAAADAGLGVCVTHAMDGTVGRLVTLHVAAACNALCPGSGWPHGLFAPGLASLAREPELAPDRLALPHAPGAGIELHPATLNPLWDAFTDEPMPDLAAEFALHQPGSVALDCPGDQSWTAGRLETAVQAAAEALARLGTTAGTVVGLEGEPDAGWLTGLLACWRLGAIAAPLNYRSTPRERDRAARVMGCSLRWRPGGETVTSTSPVTGKPIPQSRALLRVCTSGSTGEPRCIELTTRQLLSGAAASANRLGHRDEDRWLVCLPVNHVGALAAIFRCLNNRITLELHPDFDPERVSHRLDSGQVTLVSLVPAMLQSILDLRQDQPMPGALRAILLGGAATGPKLLQRCRQAGLPVALTWGMTEAGSQLATRKPGDLSDPAEGLPLLPFLRVRRDEQGRLVVSGPQVGGTNEDDELVTGDLGVITATGQVRILGRADDVIIRGGENIHPQEVEDLLQTCPGVQAVVVLGAPDDRLGQVPVAFIEGRALDAGRLRDWCRQHTDGFKVPARFVFLEQMPRTSAGKPDRQALRQHL